MSAGLRPVRVAVEAVADRPERTFSYLLPSELGEPAPGSLLLVPYGRRLALGYLLPGGSEVAVEGLKDGRGDRLGADADARSARAGRGHRDLLPSADRDDARRDAAARPRVAARPHVGRRGRGRAPGRAPSARRRAGRIGDASLQRHAPRRGRTAWLEQLRRSGAIRAEWSLRPPEVSARRVRVVRAGAVGRRAAASRAGSAGDPRGARRRRVDDAGPGRSARDGSGAASSRRRGGWRRWAASSSGGEPSNATPSRIGPRACRSETSLRRSNVPPSTRSARSPPGGELLLEGVAASGKTDVYLAAIQETLDGRAGRRSCSSRR